MAFKNAQQSRVLAGGLHYSGFAKGFNFGLTVDQYDTTSLVDTAKQFIPGQNGSEFSIDLMLDTDTTAGGLWDVTTGWKGSAEIPVTFAPSGLPTGSECFMVRGFETAFGQTSAPNNVVTASLSGLTNGCADVGTILEDLTAVTVDTTGSARDGGAGTSNGGIAHLHVTAFSGLDSDDITIEHSANGSTGWATLVTFTSVTAIGGESIVVAPGTTVNRYLRVVDDATGTGSITRTVAFARR